MASVDIVIVSWNAGAGLAECIASIADARADGIEIRRVVLVDNASTDGSLDGAVAAGSAHGVPLHVVRNEENRGFGPACNQGAALGDSDHVLFLNPDTRLFADSLARPLAELAASPDVGVAGIALVDDDGAVSRSCARFPRPMTYAWIALGLDRLGPFRRFGYRMSDWDHASTRDVDHVMGAFFLVRRPVFESVGGFDEDYFVYFEDIDLSRRIARAGHRSRFLADARAYHQGGGTTRGIPARRLALFLRGKLRYARKHHGPATFALAVTTTLVIEPFARIAWELARGRFRDAAAVVSGYAQLVRGSERPTNPEATASPPALELRSRAHG